MSITEMMNELLKYFDEVRIRRRGAIYQVRLFHSDQHAATYGGQDLASALRNAIALSLG